MEKMKRNETLDCFKGVLIILVVIRHALQYSVADEGGLITNYIWAVQMPGFMLISGYLGAKKIDSSKDMFISMKKSFIRYCVPFFSWFVLITVLLLGHYNRNIISGLSYLSFHVDSGLWFLWVLFILSLFAAVCNYFCKGSKKILSIFIRMIICYSIFASILLCGTFTFGIKFLGIKYILYYSLFYGIGYLCKVPTMNGYKCENLKVIHVCSFVSLLVFLTIIFNYDIYNCDDNLVSIFLRFVSGITGCEVMLYVIKYYQSLLKRIKVDTIGKYTMEIYVTHMNYCQLMGEGGQTDVLFSINGLMNFGASMVIIIVLTLISILILRSIPLANKLFYGR